MKKFLSELTEAVYHDDTTPFIFPSFPKWSASNSISTVQDVGYESIFTLSFRLAARYKDIKEVAESKSKVVMYIRNELYGEVANELERIMIEADTRYEKQTVSALRSVISRMRNV